MGHFSNYIKSAGRYLAIFTFSIYTRIVLCLALTLTQSRSVLFNILIVVIFCLPIARYITCSITKTKMAERENTVIFCMSCFLYVSVYAQILNIYSFPDLLVLFMISIPCILHYIFFLATDQPKTNKNYLLITLCFYTLPFLLAINCVFDFHAPTTKKYFIRDRHHQNVLGTDTDTHFYYLYLRPATSGLSKGDRKNLKNYEKKEVDEEIYNASINNQYVDIHTHPGLLGIAWITYHY